MSKDLAKDIYEFLDKWATIRPDYDPEFDTDDEKFTSPDASELKSCADLITQGLKPTECFSSWESGGYKPYSSKEGRSEHDILLKRIKQFNIKNHGLNIKI